MRNVTEVDLQITLNDFSAKSEDVKFTMIGFILVLSIDPLITRVFVTVSPSNLIQRADKLIALMA